MSALVQSMTFLALCQRALLESGSSLLATPTTTVNASGEWKRICNWVSNAYVELQNKRPDWEWMEQDVQFDTVNQQQAYAPATTVFTTPAGTGLPDFRRWKTTSTTGECSFRLYLKSAGVNNETNLDGTMDYTQFRDYYIFGAKRNTYARPISICVDPKKSLLLGFTPNDVYSVDGKYYQDSVAMAVDADTPVFPARYHMILVWMALESYAMYTSAPEVLERSKRGYKPLWTAMEFEQLPDFQLPDTLVG